MSGAGNGRAQGIDAAVVVLLCFGLFIVESLSMAYSNAAWAQGAVVTDASLVGLMVQECVLGAMALAYLHLRGYRLGTHLPRPTAVGTAIGAMLYGAVALAIWVLWWLTGPTQAVEPIEVMLAQAQFSIPAIIAVAIVNGAYEEFFMLGIVMPLLARGGGSFAVGMTVLLRVLYHVYQGPHGAVSVAIFGVALGAYYWRTHKLWPVVCAHVIADLFGLAT